MPLSNIQKKVLLILAAQRDAESYVAGAAPLNRDAARYSQDIDVFHDRAERVSQAALADTKLLAAAGYTIQWLRQEPLIYTAEIKREAESTRLEWVVDSDYRFFPTMRDAEFGYLLHPVDLALNKIMAAVGRREVRDVVDLVTIHETILPLGAAIWAAVEKSPGFNPEGLIAEIRRTMIYPAAAWQTLTSASPLDPLAVTGKLRAALDEADAFVRSMPSGKLGLLFISGGKVEQPNPERLQDYETHTGQRRGHWPASGEILGAMLERYRVR